MEAAKFVPALLIGMVLVATVAESITCGQVVSSLSSCIPYAQGKVASVPPGCCSGIKSLNSAAKTTADRQATCNCLKSLAGSYRGINFGIVAGLPSRCGVSVPYKISPSTDCTKVK